MANPYLDQSVLGAMPAMDDPLALARSLGGLTSLGPMVAGAMEPPSKPEPIVTHYSSVPTGVHRFVQFTEVFAKESIDLSGSTLVLATIGTGNVGQLAVDALLTTLNESDDVRKIGYVKDRNMLAAVGNDAMALSSTCKGVITTAAELFWIPSKKLCVFQQRTQLRLGGRVEFTKTLCKWIKEKKFAAVVALTSDSITRRSEVQIEESATFVCYDSGHFPTTSPLAVTLATLKWPKSLKATKKPASSSLLCDEEVDTRTGDSRPLDESLAPSSESKADDSSADETDIVGGGITKLLFDECKLNGTALLVLCRFAFDGDNSEDAILLLKRVESLFWTGSDAMAPVKLPKSWSV